MREENGTEVLNLCFRQLDHCVSIRAENYVTLQTMTLMSQSGICTVSGCTVLTGHALQGSICGVKCAHYLWNQGSGWPKQALP